MKIRNRKLVTGIVATFMAILMTGVAFAFAAQGPLNFTGTANVNAALALAILPAPYSFAPAPVGADEGATSSLALTVPVASVGGSGYRTAAMTADFNRPDQSATFNFVVQNIGTIPAQIAPIALEIEDDSSYRLVWTQYGVLATLGAILQPGDTIPFSFSVAFDAEGFTGWEYEATTLVSFVLNYGLVGSYYVPDPGPIGPDLPPVPVGYYVVYEWAGIGIGSAVNYQIQVVNHNFWSLDGPSVDGPHERFHSFVLASGVPIQSEGYWLHRGSHTVNFVPFLNWELLTYTYEILFTFGICPETGANAITSARFAIGETALYYRNWQLADNPGEHIIELIFGEDGVIVTPSHTLLP